MLELCTLASGSSGNSLLVTDGRTHVLVDAGISCRRICTGLKELGVEPTELAGVLITHEHSDHISGLTTLTKQLRLPVYASPGTGRQLCYRIAFLEELLRPVAPGEGFSVGGLAIESFPTSHDAAESVGYALSAGGRKAAVVTDLGYVTGAVLRGIRGADLLVAEANHDVEWVQSGPYPYHLKARILGDRGHLSNEAGAELAWTAVEGGARTVVLAHLSHENNPRPGPRGGTGRTGAPGRGSGPGRGAGGGPPQREEPEVHGMKGIRVQLICVGKMKEKFYIDAAAEYVKRLSAYCKLQVVELPEERLPSNPSQAQIDAALEKEAAAIRARLAPGASLIALCVEGCMRSSEELSGLLSDWSSRGGSSLAFLIGGSYGLAPSLKAQAWAKLSMSPMTFPHHLARVMLLEQLYRSFKIDEGSSYHK